MCRDFIIILWPSQNIWNLASKIYDGKTTSITKGCVNLITNFPFNSCGCIFGCRCPMLWNWRSGLHCRQIWPQNFTDIVQCFHGFTSGCSWNLFLLGWKSNLLWKWYPTFPGPKCMTQIAYIFIKEILENYLYISLYSSDLGFGTSSMARSFENIHQIVSRFYWTRCHKWSWMVTSGQLGDFCNSLCYWIWTFMLDDKRWDISTRS